jgi:hypothetical protein
MFRRRRTKLLTSSGLPAQPDHDQVEGLLALWAREMVQIIPPLDQQRRMPLDSIELRVGAQWLSLGALNDWLEHHMETAMPEVFDIVAAPSRVPVGTELQPLFAPALVAAEAAVVLARNEDPSVRNTSALQLLSRPDRLSRNVQQLLHLTGMQQSLALIRMSEPQATSSGIISVPKRPVRFVHVNTNPVATLHAEAFGKAQERLVEVPGSTLTYGSHYQLNVVAFDPDADRVQVQEYGTNGRPMVPREVSRKQLIEELTRRLESENGPSAPIMGRSVKAGPIDVQLPPSPRQIHRPEGPSSPPSLT